MQKLQQAREDRKIIQQWQRKDIRLGIDIPEKGACCEYANYPSVMAVAEMIEAWKQRNYGKLGDKLSLLFSDCTIANKRAGACRTLFEKKELKNFHFVSVKEEGCSMQDVEIHAEWRTAEKTCEGTLRFGCVYENDSVIAYPWRNNGVWKLYPRDVRALYSSES